MNRNKIKNIIYICLGIIFVGVGILGIFLPLLPTTIFLIIATYFFLNSSPKLNTWLEEHKILGTYIKAYKKNSGMPLKAKFITIIFLWVSIAYSAFAITDNIFLRIILFIIAISVTIYLLRIKTLKLESSSLPYE